MTTASFSSAAPLARRSTRNTDHLTTHLLDAADRPAADAGGDR
ncbi:hypothetical protein [Oerskovia merdavium]|nr:hypothetical protein [Oerskovia merdavium]